MHLACGVVAFSQATTPTLSSAERTTHVCTPTARNEIISDAVTHANTHTHTHNLCLMCTRRDLAHWSMLTGARSSTLPASLGKRNIIRDHRTAKPFLLPARASARWATGHVTACSHACALHRHPQAEPEASSHDSRRGFTRQFQGACITVLVDPRRRIDAILLITL